MVKAERRWKQQKQINKSNSKMETEILINSSKRCESHTSKKNAPNNWAAARRAFIRQRKTFASSYLYVFGEIQASEVTVSKQMLSKTRCEWDICVSLKVHMQQKRQQPPPPVINQSGLTIREAQA